MEEQDWLDFPNFWEGEFRCRCGCGAAAMDREFIDLLQQLRSTSCPMIVSSGYRCPAHNTAVSSTGDDGPHTTGKAADIQIVGEGAMNLLRHAINDERFTGIGINQRGPLHGRFIHLDILNTAGMRPALWNY